MEEIKIKNELDLKVYINGVPDIKLIPDDINEGFISFLEQEINRNLFVAPFISKL